MRFVSLLAWLMLRPWRRHPVRQALTVLSIALGVALFLATELTLGAIGNAVEGGQQTLAAGADLTAGRASAGLSMAEVRALRARAEFATVAASVVAHARTADGQRLSLVGVEPAHGMRLLGEGAAAEVDFVRLALDPRALVLTREGAQALGVGRDDALELATARGRQRLVVAGLVDVPPAARTLLRDCAFLPLASAQRLLGHGDRVDRVDLWLAPGTDLAAGREAVRACAPTATVGTPADRAQQQLGALAGLRAMLVLESLLALLVALFFIYNTVSAAVADRSRDAGLLRCLGLTRGGLRALLLGEAACAGALGFAAGAGLGFLLGRAALSIMVATVGLLYLQIPPVEDVHFRGGELAAAFALAVGLSLLAAMLASRSLVRLPALAFLRPVLAGTLQARRLRAAAVFGLALLLGAFALGMLAPSPPPFPVGRIVSLLLPAGLGLAAPLLVVAAARRLRALAARRGSVSLLLAIDAIVAHPTRTALTIVAFALSLGLVVGHGGVAGSMTATLRNWLLRAIPGDVIVGASFASALPDFPIDAAVAEPLRALPGVEAVVRLRAVRIPLGERHAMCMALDLAEARGRSEHDYVAGARDDAIARCIAGEAVIVSENLSFRAGLRLGDPVPLPAAEGVVHLPVAAIIRDFNSPLGTVFLDYAVYRRLFADPLIDFAELGLAPGAPADPAAIVAQMRAVLPEEFRDLVQATTKASFIEGALAAVDDINNLSLVQILLASSIGSVGILVTVMLSVLARRRELALLRAVGMDHAALQRAVVVEVCGLALAASLLGLVIGNVVFWPANLVFREFAGFQFAYAFPGWYCALAVAVACATAVVSAIPPLRLVARLSVAEAVAEE